MIFKLLIVDDEATMRKGIANFINWDSIDCEIAGTASDGIEAIEFLKENAVDIVITDIKMPGADGLEVARYIYEALPQIKVILLTGYADFEYAKTAIKYNVSAFILKPTNKKDLLEAVQNAQKQIITSSHRSSVAKEELSFLKDKLLQELTNQPYSSSFEQRLLTLDLHLDHYYVVAFQLVPLGNDLASLKRIIISEKKDAYCYRYNNLIIAVYFLDHAYKAVPSTVLDNCREITEIAYTLDSREVAVGISQYHHGTPEFSMAVSEAIYALTLNFYSEDNIAMFSDFANLNEYDLTAENSLDLFQFENSLNNWLFDDADVILNSMFSKLKSNFVSSWDAKSICSQIYYICSRVLIKKDIAPPSSGYLSKINDAPDIFALKTTVSDLMQYVRENSIKTASLQNRLVEHTIKYIHDNLSSPLSLEIIAEHLHISPSHLSRTFKKSCNESLTEFINKTRIEKAKDYLVHSDILTYEIAEKVGYNDAAYFSSIFKRYTGMSPTDYRQQSHVTNPSTPGDQR